MGNEASSVRIHSALTAEDIKGLRTHFPGGGNGDPPKNLMFEPWGRCWHEDERAQLESIMKQKEDFVTFHSYQELAGTAVRGTSEARVKLLFRLLDRPDTKTIRSGELLTFVRHIVQAVAKLINGGNKDEDESNLALAKSLMHELIFPGEMAKNCLVKEIPADVYLDFDMIERWLVMKCPLFDQLYLFALATSFGISVNSSAAGMLRPPLVPSVGIDFKTSSPSSALTPEQVIFLNHQLLQECRSLWRPLFNSKQHGESFAKLSAAMLANKGPSLIVVWEKNGHIFGGFASDSWTLSPKFTGSNLCFLFNLSPKMAAYESARFNTNYMYMNLKQKTMPNGVGMGGQLEYFGLWLDSEFGKGKCAKSCTSYQSPQLSKEEEFRYTHLELWGLGEEKKEEGEEEGETRGALDLDPEAQALMEMMGKTFVSKDVRAQDEQMEKDRRDENAANQKS